jgi:5'(3')-deoxyribonucleotidase
MDGTIANLYGRKDWLKDLRQEKENVFDELEVITVEEVVLSLFPTDKYIINILSMTPKQASESYCKKVIEEKNKWLDKHFPNLNGKRIYRPYGHNKNLKNSKNAILIDDSQEIRRNWKGIALNPSELW